MTTTSTMND